MTSVFSKCLRLFRLAGPALYLLISSAPLAAKTVAMVVGNDAYREITPLQKARADARGYADFLTARGAEVHLHLDLAGRDMRLALSRFLDRIEPGDTVVFVYSGHGWSDGRENYLLMTDVPGNSSASFLQTESMALKNDANGIVDLIHARSPALTVAIVDACRNNPFELSGNTRSLGLGQGLTRVMPPTGTFIAFSAGAGQTALDRLTDDDPAPYSVFTRHFLKELEKPQDLQTAFKATQAAVNAAASTVGHAQRPAYYDEVIGSACLTGMCAPGTGAPAAVQAAAPAPAPVLDAAAVARAEWQDFRESTSPQALRMFAERHAATPYAALALDRAVALETAAVPAPQPVPQPRTYQQPSWCPKAGTPTERAICADPELSALDLRMGQLFQWGLQRGGGNALRSAQRAWLQQRDVCGVDVACIRFSYQTRNAVLMQ
jgi:uncharacterized protein YecT (DUF1311 family)